MLRSDPCREGPDGERQRYPLECGICAKLFEESHVLFVLRQESVTANNAAQRDGLSSEEGDGTGEITGQDMFRRVIVTESQIPCRALGLSRVTPLAWSGNHFETSIVDRPPQLKSKTVVSLDQPGMRCVI